MAQANLHRCPFCGAEYERPFVVCTQCGMNRQTGRMPEPTIVEEDDEQEKPSRAMRAVMWAAEYLPGFFRPLVLIAAIVLGIVGLGIVLMGVVLLMMPALVAAFCCMAVGSLAYAQAVAWVLWGELGFLPDQLTDFDEIRWTLWFVGLLTPGVVFVVIAVAYTGTGG